jgi:acetyl esterase/lipase
MAAALVVVAGASGSDAEPSSSLTPEPAAARALPSSSTLTVTTTTVLAPPVPVAVPHLLTSEPVAHAATYAYGPDPHQLLDVIVPPSIAPDGPPVVVYLHSGGWIAGERKNVPELVTRQLSRGWAIVSVDYGLAPADRFPAPVEDADLAVRWVRANARALGLRSDRIVAAGSSAGGHLAAWLAANPSVHRAHDVALADVPSGVDAAVLLVAPVVMSDLRQHEDTFAPAILAAYLGCPDGQADRCSDEVMAAADPTRDMGEAPAPVYALHGALDHMFPAAIHGDAITTAWREAGGIAVVEVAPFGGHDLDPTNTDVGSLDRFLDAVLAGG